MSKNIAIDGPAGAGKSTIAKQIAKRLNYIYVDTGAMYRAMALYLMRQGVNPADVEQIGRVCQNASISIAYENGEQVVYLNGENVNAYLRTEEVGNMASATSVVPKLREKLVSLQKELAAQKDCVMDGRDIGTCVLPKADVKIYLTASSLVRARRRMEELLAKGQSADLETIKADIEERDYRDMHRETSPLCQAQDAVLVDNSDMTLEQGVERILEVCKEKGLLS